MNSEQIFEWAVKFVLEHEGDWVDDDQDPGGETNFGVSAVHNPDLDVAGMDRIDAIRVYRERYWERYKCDELHPTWALALFDATVNQPATWAVRQLQAVVGVKQDGIMGPVTVGAANRTRSDYHLQLFMARRIDRYVTREHYPRFGTGWLRRALDCYAVARSQG